MSQTTNDANNPNAAPVLISGAVHVSAATPRRVAPHAPAPARPAATSEADDGVWYELERIMAARAASMAAHPTGRSTHLPLAS